MKLVKKVSWLPPVLVKFNLTELAESHARRLLSALVTDQITKKGTDRQNVYIIRLSGSVAIDYPKRASSVIYVGSGNAVSRIKSHRRRLVALLHKITGAGLSIHIATPRRRRFKKFYKYIEADFIRLFFRLHGALPLLNRNKERKLSGKMRYSPKVSRQFRKKLLIGPGQKVLWSILPTRRNRELFDVYRRGIPEKIQNLIRQLEKSKVDDSY